MNFKKILFVLITTIFCFQSFAQKDHSAYLKKDLVKIEGGKYVSTSYHFLTFDDGHTAQIKMAATCPIDVMSRDNFISIYSTYGTIFLLELFKETGTPDIKELDELIGDPDITIKFVMAKNGVQLQIIGNGTQENLTLKWEDILG